MVMGDGGGQQNAAILRIASLTQQKGFFVFVHWRHNTSSTSSLSQLIAALFSRVFFVLVLVLSILFSQKVCALYF
jgi:hypothetical protein